MKSVDIRPSNDLQWPDLKIGHRDKSPITATMGTWIGMICDACICSRLLFCGSWWRHDMDIFFHITGPLWGESTVHQSILIKKNTKCAILCYFCSKPEQGPYLWSCQYIESPWRSCDINVMICQTQFPVSVFRFCSIIHVKISDIRFLFLSVFEQSPGG